MQFLDLLIKRFEGRVLYSIATAYLLYHQLGIGLYLYAGSTKPNSFLESRNNGLVFCLVIGSPPDAFGNSGQHLAMPVFNYRTNRGWTGISTGSPISI